MHIAVKQQKNNTSVATNQMQILQAVVAMKLQSGQCLVKRLGKQMCKPKKQRNT